MHGFKKEIVKIIEFIAILAIGLLFTLNVAGPIYERYGIEFIGNVWVNWFGFQFPTGEYKGITP